MYVASLAGMKPEDRRIVRTCGFLNDTKLAPDSVSNNFLVYF